MKKLNLGCGEDYKEGWVNADIGNTFKKDVEVDLHKLPLPFEDNTFDYIFTAHVLEHLDYNKIGGTLVPLIIELHRILKPNGRLEIRVPHVSWIGSLGILGLHRNVFSLNCFQVLLHEDLIQYEPEIKYPKFPFFQLVEQKLYHQRTERLGKLLVKKNWYYYISKFISYLANLSPRFCEKIWCYWFGGFQELKIILKKVDHSKDL